MPKAPAKPKLPKVEDIKIDVDYTFGRDPENNDFVLRPDRTFYDVANKDGFYVTKQLHGTTPQTAANYGIIFIAWHPCEVIAVQEVHETAGTDGGAVTLQVEKLTGTTAPGSGSNLLTTAFNLKSAINTVVSKTTPDLTTTKADLRLERGDRLALKDSGTLTAVAGVNVTIYLKPLGKGDYR